MLKSLMLNINEAGMNKKELLKVISKGSYAGKLFRYELFIDKISKGENFEISNLNKKITSYLNLTPTHLKINENILEYIKNSENWIDFSKKMNEYANKIKDDKDVENLTQQITNDMFFIEVQFYNKDKKIGSRCLVNSNILLKSQEFGGNGATGNGVKVPDETKIIETLQAIMFNLYVKENTFQNLINSLKDDINKSSESILNMSRELIKYNKTTSLMTFADKNNQFDSKFLISAITYPDWLYSSMLTIKNLVNKEFVFNDNSTTSLEEILNAKNHYVLRTLNEKFSKLKELFNVAKAEQKEDSSGDKIIFSDFNKFNPSDIWIIENGFDFNDFYDKLEVKSDEMTSFEHLREIMEELFDSKKMIGLSLKKYSDKNKEYIQIINHSKITKPKVKFNKFYVKNTKLTNSIDIYVEFSMDTKNVDIQFRDFSSWTWQGEIKGIEANGGKIGYNILSNVIESNFSDFPSSEDISKLFINFNKELKNIKSEKNVYNSLSKKAKEEFKVFYNTYFKARKHIDGINQNYAIESLCDEIYNSTWRTKMTNQIRSKYAGLKMVEIVYKKTPKKSSMNKICDDIVSYASSMTMDSSVFIKIGK
jgi:hypothetical protein